MSAIRKSVLSLASFFLHYVLGRDDRVRSESILYLGRHTGWHKFLFLANQPTRWGDCLCAVSLVSLRPTPLDTKNAQSHLLMDLRP
jgi:hypothetical protein